MFTIRLKRSFLLHQHENNINNQKNVPLTENNNILSIVHIRELYPIHYQYSDLSSHPGIVLFPYQVSFMSFFELYRMNIPMCVPSPEFLVKLHQKYDLLNERTWNSVYGHKDIASVISKHENSSSKMKYDPNDDLNYDAILEWIKLSDYYTHPYIIQFDSFEHLIQLLTTTDLNEISNKMMKQNIILKQEIDEKWENILKKIQLKKTFNNNNDNNKLLKLNKETADIALQRNYGFALSSGCEGIIE